MTLREMMRRERQRRGHTQEAAAGDIGVTRKTVSLWETGASFPGLLRVRAVAMYIGVSMDDLESLRPAGVSR